MKKLIITFISAITSLPVFAYTQSEFETRFNTLNFKDTEYADEFFASVDRFPATSNEEEKMQLYARSIYLNCKIYLNTSAIQDLIEKYPQYYKKQFDAQSRTKHQTGIQSRLNFNSMYFQLLQKPASSCTETFGIYSD